MTSLISFVIFATLLAPLANCEVSGLLCALAGHAKTQLQQTQISFTFRSGADGTTTDGASFSAVSYVASDGVVVTSMSEEYPSKRRAELALKKKLRKAIKIDQRGAKFDRNGKRIGTRVQATYSPDDKFNSPATIIWTEGSQLHSIGSVSLRHVLEFEKQFP